MRQTITFEEIAQLFKVGQSIRAFFPHLDNFERKQGIQLLSFPCNYKDVFDTLGIHDGAAVRVLAAFLAGDDRRFYMTKSRAGVRQGHSAPIGTGPLMHSWSVVFNDFLKRYCTEDVLPPHMKRLQGCIKRRKKRKPGFLTA